MSLFVSPRLTMLASKEYHADLAPLTERIDTGQLTPSIDAIYPLEHARDAMRQLEAGTVRVRVSITIGCVPCPQSSHRPGQLRLSRLPGRAVVTHRLGAGFASTALHSLLVATNG